MVMDSVISTAIFYFSCWFLVGLSYKGLEKKPHSWGGAFWMFLIGLGISDVMRTKHGDMVGAVPTYLLLAIVPLFLRLRSRFKKALELQGVNSSSEDCGEKRKEHESDK